MFSKSENANVKSYKSSTATDNHEEYNMNIHQEEKFKRCSPTKKQIDSSKRMLIKAEKKAADKKINEYLDYKPGTYLPMISGHKNTQCIYDWFQVSMEVKESRYKRICKEIDNKCGLKWKTNTDPKRRNILENYGYIESIHSIAKEANRDGFDNGCSIIVEKSSSPVVILFRKRKTKGETKYTIRLKINPSHHCIDSADNVIRALKAIHNKFIGMIRNGLVTRIDCAIDIFNMSIRNFFFIPKSLQKTFVAIGRTQELEYLSHGNRRNAVKFYDKKKEIKEKKSKKSSIGKPENRIVPLVDATRIEFSKHVNITTKQLLKEKYWPEFSSLQCYEISKVHYPNRFFMELSQITGLHTNLKKLAPPDRAQAMQYLKDAQVSLPVNNEDNVSFEQASLIVRYIAGTKEERQSIRQINPGRVSQYIHSGLITKQLMELSTDFTNELNDAQIAHLKEITPNYEEIKTRSKPKKKSKFPLGLPITREEAIRLIALRKFK